MRSDYCYCSGFGYFDQPKLCQDCKRHVPRHQPIPDYVIWWTEAQYNPQTEDCPQYVPNPNYCANEAH